MALFVALVVAAMIFLSGVALAITTPELIDRALREVSVKFLILYVAAIMTVFTGVVVYWTFSRPRPSRLFLGGARACLIALFGAVAAPPILYAFEKISLALGEELIVNVSIAGPSAISTATTIVVTVFGYWKLARDYESAYAYERQNGWL